MANKGMGYFIFYLMEKLVGPDVTYGTILSERSYVIHTEPSVRFLTGSSGLEAALFANKLYLVTVILFL